MLTIELHGGTHWITWHIGLTAGHSNKNVSKRLKLKVIFFIYPIDSCSSEYTACGFRICTFSQKLTQFLVIWPKVVSYKKLFQAITSVIGKYSNHYLKTLIHRIRQKPLTDLQILCSIVC